jgi:hypothetical protein
VADYLSSTTSWPISCGGWAHGHLGTWVIGGYMQRLSRRGWCSTPWRHDHWPAFGFVGTLVFLVGCSLSQTPGNTPDSGAVTSGHVTVTASKAQYGPTETVSVTIANGLSSGILAADHQSDCTVLLIEYLTGQTWQAQNLCRLKSPTRLISFGAGTATSQLLHPPSGPNASGWSVGTYRIAFTYRQSPSGPETTVYSAQFTIA